MYIIFNFAAVASGLLCSLSQRLLSRLQSICSCINNFAAAVPLLIDPAARYPSPTSALRNADCLRRWRAVDSGAGGDFLQCRAGGFLDQILKPAGQNVRLLYFHRARIKGVFAPEPCRCLLSSVGNWESIRFRIFLAHCSKPILTVLSVKTNIVLCFLVKFSPWFVLKRWNIKTMVIAALHPWLSLFNVSYYDIQFFTPTILVRNADIIISKDSFISILTPSLYSSSLACSSQFENETALLFYRDNPQVRWYFL